MSEPKKLGPGDDLEMMRSFDNWPVWPTLPMKRYVDGQLEPAILVELITSYQYAFVPGVTMYDKVKASDPRIERFSKDNIERLQAILADGWMVD